MTEQQFERQSGGASRLGDDTSPSDGWGGLRVWLRSDAAARWLLVLILVVGAYLRLSHLDWDEGAHIHPDERFLTMVVDALRLPKNLAEFFDSTRSPMSPYNKNYGFFVYGTLPIFVVKVVAEVANALNKTAQLFTAAPGVPLDLVGYGGVHLVGRALSGLFDLGCVWLIYLIGRRLYRRRVGLTAAALYAFAVLPLQQSHFFTADTFGTFFALLTFYLAVRVAQGGQPADRGVSSTVGPRGGGWLTYVALGASLGASIACRMNLAPLAGVAVLAAMMRAWDDWHVALSVTRSPMSAESRARERVWISTLLQATLFRLLLMGIVAVAVFRVAQPYSFGGTHVLDFSLSPKWLANMRQVGDLMSGAADTPPGHQWANRTPFVFPWVNMVIWGMGLPMGIAAWIGWALAAVQLARGLTGVGDSRKVRAHLLPVAWIGVMFLWQGMLYVQSMRYLLPLYPLLAMMAAWLLWWLVATAGRRLRIADRRLQIADEGLQIQDSRSRIADDSLRMAQKDRSSDHRRSSIFNLQSLAYALLAFVVIGTMLWGWGFLAIYRRPLTRITASRWIYQNVAPGSRIGNEHWDDGLPLRVDGKDGFGSFGYKSLSSSSDGNMQMYWEDTAEKREQLYRWLNEADYLVLSSNRLWGSIPRLPMRFPMTTLYYQLLFQEKLGFEQVLHVTSFPTIFGLQFPDTGAEEAFSVYDHPEVYILKKTPGYSESLVRSYLDRVDLETVIQMWPKQISAAPTALMLTPEEAERQQAGGTWSDIFDERSLVNRTPALSILAWLLLLEALGLIALPLAFVALRGLSDRGYGVSKTLGVLLLAWLSWVGPSLKLLPYQRWEIALALGLMAGIAAAAAWRRRTALAAFVRERWRLLLTEEALFLLLFGLFLLIRFGNPDLWHPARGGEKPMDFAYLNAVIRSTTFPPYDPWHAGGFMNYYYFGFVIVGTLVKLSGVLPWVAYNLAVPTLFALTGLGAFSVAYSLADGNPEARSQRDEADSGVRGYLAGLAAMLLVAIVGNLGNVKLLLDQWSARSTVQIQTSIPGLAKLVRGLDGAIAWLSGKQPLSFPNDWWFWNASRTIPETINEFPFFTFTYADLHAHMIALPLTLLGLAAAVALVRVAGGEWQARKRQPRAGIGESPSTSNLQSAISAEPSPWCISLAELLPIVLIGLVLGALRGTNTWDFPTYTLVGLAAIVVLEASRRLRMWDAFCGGAQAPAMTERLAFLFRTLVSVVWRAGIMVGTALLTFYPYSRWYATAYAGLQPWQTPKTKISEYLTVHGFFLALVAIYLLSELAQQLRGPAGGDDDEEGRPVFAFGATGVMYIVVAAALVLAAGIAMRAQVWLIALPLLTLAVILAFGRDIPPARRMALLLIALALAITMGVEVVRQRDDIGRMNTVFKFYLQAWVLFGVAAAVGLESWVVRARDWTPGVRRLAWAVTLVLLAGVMLYPATAARAKVRDRFSADASPRGIDGIAFMDSARYSDNNRDMRMADDKAAILWMLRNVAGSPVVLEGNTPGYRWGSRFSIYTGLPAVQGWDWHQKQQRSVVPHAEVDRRLANVREMYDTVDLARAQKLLDRYDVSYIIVGELERAYYTARGLAKFDILVTQGYLRLAYEGGAVRIYQVVGRGTPVTTAPDSRIGPQPVPTPTPAAALPAVAVITRP